MNPASLTIQMQTPTQDRNDMKLPPKFFLCSLLALSLPALGQTINWTGAGDGVSWNSPLNWSGGAVPSPTNDVVIASGAGTNVVISSGSITVKSIQCTKAFTISGGSLTVTNGASQFSGQFAMSAGTVLYAIGSNTTFICTGPTSEDGANFFVAGGAVVMLPALQNYNGGCGHFTWTVVGPNSVLNLPGLTNMTQPSCGNGGQILAQAGGQILATNLASIAQAGDPETVQADGTNSLIDFRSLRTVSGTYAVTFVASNGGTNWVPLLIGGPNAYVTLNPGATLPVAQITQLGGITASGVTVSLPALTGFDGGSVSLSGGAVVTLPALQSYSTGCGMPSWTVVGPNSQLDLPGLTNITVLYCGSGMNIQALAGGQVLATNLASIVGGWTETVQADGTNSLIDFRSLRTVSGTYPVTFVASNGGTNWVPLMGGPNAYVTLNPGATLPVAQIPQLGGITASGMTVSFPALTSFDGGSVSLSGGAVVTLPALQNYNGGCGHFTWTVVGPNSVLNLPGLTNMTQPSCGNGGQILAQAGGQILATNLASIAQAGDPETVQADG